jgi:hypothetical protein
VSARRHAQTRTDTPRGRRACQRWHVTILHASRLLARCVVRAWAPCSHYGINIKKSKWASSQRLTRRTHAHTAPGTGFFHRSAPTGGDAYGMPRNCRPLSVTTPRTGPSAAQTSTSTRATHAASQPPQTSHSLRFAVHTSLDDILLRERRHQRGEQQRDDGSDHVLKARPWKEALKQTTSAKTVVRARSEECGTSPALTFMLGIWRLCGGCPQPRIDCESAGGVAPALTDVAQSALV